MEVSGQLHAPAALNLLPFKEEAGWAPELVRTLWRRENIPAPVVNPTPVWSKIKFFQQVLVWVLNFTEVCTLALEMKYAGRKTYALQIFMSYSYALSSENA